MKNSNIILMLSFLLSWPILALAAGSECTTSDSGGSDRSMAMKIKFIALASILAAGGLGVLIPILGRRVSALQPEKDVFFVVKAFAAGVILATGMIHILPVAFKNLTSPCLGREFLRKFPLAAFVAMVASLATLMIDAYATSYYRRSHFSKARPVDDGAGDEEAAGEHADHVHVHTHATHGHSHGAAAASPGEDDRLSETIRRRVVSQVLELGILVHSVIIGISLGASIHPSTIKPLMGALSFHQFFEGMGLGGCIVQVTCFWNPFLWYTLVKIHVVLQHIYNLF
ncbi:hypothetical protein Taro_043646 [Colocasia esculenta]|uniref:Uncharacterized protein n=1 Tax=Colocasia esculenta TaxID=4460 RepID=A0A843WLM7_COLES|nr:hypothetical protein [Colocasia esculenta]